VGRAGWIGFTQLELPWRSADGMRRRISQHIVVRRESEGSVKRHGEESRGNARMFVHHALGLALGLVLALGCASRVCADAEKVVVGPSRVDAGGEAVRTAAVSALGDALRLQGLNVILFEDAKTQLPRGDECDEACAARLLRAVSADMSAVVQIGADAEKLPNRALVTLRDAQNHRYEGAASVRDGDVRDATTRAVLEARSYQLLGPGPWLRVSGTPDGADVKIDGNSVGKLPYRASMTPGEHRVTVGEAGYVRFTETVNVPADDSRKVDVKVALEPLAIDAPASAIASDAGSEPRVSTSGDSTWLLLPIAMGVVGLGWAAAISVRLAAGVEPCVNPDISMHCMGEQRVKVAPTVAGYAISAALLGTSITWIALGTRSEQPQLTANVGLGRVALSGTF
jgi:hypothetical protein